MCVYNITVLIIICRFESMLLLCVYIHMHMHVCIYVYIYIVVTTKEFGENKVLNIVDVEL